MKKTFKKFFVLMILFLTFSSITFAQTSDETIDEDAVNMGGEFGFRIGAFFNYDAAVGDVSEFLWCNLGGGLSFEFDFPILMNADTPQFWLFLQTLGASFDVDFNGCPIKSELLSLSWNMRYSVGLHVKVPFGESGFFFYPQLNAGVMLNFPWDNLEYNNTGILKQVYVDQLYGIDLGFRYSNQYLAQDKLEFGITPFYVICPEQESAIHGFGVKLGIYFNII